MVVQYANPLPASANREGVGGGETASEQERERTPLSHCFTPQMFSMLGLGHDQELETQSMISNHLNHHHCFPGSVS